MVCKLGNQPSTDGKSGTGSRLGLSLTLRKSTMAKSKKTTPGDTDEDKPGIGIPGLK